MQIKISNQAAILYPSGVVHRETADEVDMAFQHVFAAGAKCIVISFQDVKALLSDGIRLLIALNDRAHQGGREFYITDLSKEVRYALQITNLLGLLGHAGYTQNLLQEKKIDPQQFRTEEVSAKGVTASASAPVLSAVPQMAGGAELSDDELQNWIRNFVPGRTELRIAEFLSRPTVSAKSLPEIVTSLRCDEASTTRSIERLVQRGVLRTTAEGLYDYSGGTELQTALSRMATMLQNAVWRDKILRLLASAERN